MWSSEAPTGDDIPRSTGRRSTPSSTGRWVSARTPTWWSDMAMLRGDKCHLLMRPWRRFTARSRGQTFPSILIRYLPDTCQLLIRCLPGTYEVLTWYLSGTHGVFTHYTYQAFAKGKAGQAPIAWFVSHCKAHSGRDKYINWLSKWIGVDIYGRWPKYLPKNLFIKPKIGQDVCVQKYENMANVTFLQVWKSHLRRS